MATLLRVKGIGPAEQNVVQFMLNSQKTASRTVRRHVKHLRQRFKIRDLNDLMDAMRSEKRKELQDKEGLDPKQTLGVGIGWEELREEGFSDEGYGKDFQIGGPERDWLLDEVSKREVWVEDADGEPAEIPSAMMAAICDLEDALEEAEVIS
jgi:hypothetical protein